MSDVPTPVVSGGDVTACLPAESAAFEWTLAPVPEDSSTGISCVLAEVTAAGEELELGLECAGPEGARATTLWVSATPAPPTAALRAGLAVRLWALTVDDPAQGRASYVRLETTKGGLLLAAAQAGALLPADGTDPWLPFTISPAESTCMSEETACGAQERTAIDLRRAGGAPVIAQDGSFAAVGDLGEAQLWVSAALRGAATCVGPTGAWYSLGLVAAR